MGQSVSKRLQERWYRNAVCVEVTTADRAGAGTDCNVWVILEDVMGKRSDKIFLDNKFVNDLERGTTDLFPQPHLKDFQDIHVIELGKDDSFFGDKWMVDRITIRHKGNVFVFPIQRWIKENKVYRVALYDCCLPKYSIDPSGRKEEIQERRTEYNYQQIITSGPVTVEELPEDHKFHEEYVTALFKKGLHLRSHCLAMEVFTGRISTLSDLQQLFKFSKQFPEPVSCKYWKEDEWFGLQRVQGINSNLITLCTDIPSNFGATPDMLEPILKMTLEEAMEQKRLFIINLKMLEGVSHMPKRRLVAPICLLYKNSQNQLLPLAIQLNQEMGPDNPVYLPTDDSFTWLIAKMWYNMAEAQHHQCIAHLGLTHLLMEGVCICTHRTLSPSHPVYRLLAPHFFYLLAIDSKGGPMLIDPGTWMKELSSIGPAGLRELMGKVYNEFDFGSDVNIKNSMVGRGVMDKDVLPYYPYRDDAVAIFDILEEYVSAIVMYYYDTEEKLKEDEEIQTWRKELSADRNCKLGVGLKGVPGCDNEGFSAREQLITTVCTIIHTCSVMHASVNFPQYPTYAFVPNYPLALEGPPPTDKAARTEKDLVAMLPSKDVVIYLWRVTTLLGTPGTQQLGDFEVVYLYENACVEARARLQTQLRKLGDSIKTRNSSAKHPYIYLDPTKCVPNAISI